MNDTDVRIVELEPMRVASAHGFGPEPETGAFEKLLSWARPLGLLDSPDEHPLYGFNNPDPSPGSPNYGYEVWIRVGPEVQSGTEHVRFREFAGGLYAVTRCEVPKGDFDVIGKTWKQLVAWREDSKYRCATHQWLEQSLYEDRPDLEFVLDLFIPVAE